MNIVNLFQNLLLSTQILINYYLFFCHKTIEEQLITKGGFDDLFQSTTYKNGLVISNLITEDFIPLYIKIEFKSNRINQIKGVKPQGKPWTQ